MADVFISYASEDRERVRPLAEALQGRGFSIWWDRSLASGQDYASIIEKELHGAKAVIVVWTAGSALSTFVRDEAGRARDQGRLLPVLLDPVQIPLGFGAYQAEDFTKWNGQRGAAQIQLLEESIKSKLSGKDVDSDAVARKRRRLGARIRIVSLLTVIALVVAIGVGTKSFFQPPHEDPKEHLLRLLDEGKLTPDQAIQLAQLLETQTLGAQTAANGPSSGASPAPSMAARSADEEQGAGAVVTEAEFTADAHETYDTAFAALLRHPDPGVRAGALQMTQDATRDAGVQALWAYAQSHPDDPARAQIYLVCGTVGERNNNPLGQRALEIASTLSPDNPRVWRMLSHSYGRSNNGQEAQAAAEVGAGVVAQEQGQAEVAEHHFEQALPNLSSTGARAFAASSLGNIAERRQDWNAASARYGEAYRLREQAATETPNAPAAAPAALQEDAQRLVTALDRAGRSQEACQRLQQANEAHDVNAPDQALATRCQNDFRVRLRPAAANRIRNAPAQQVPPARTTP